MKLELPLAVALLAAGCLLWPASTMPGVPAEDDARFSSTAIPTDRPDTSNRYAAATIAYDQVLEDSKQLAGSRRVVTSNSPSLHAAGLIYESSENLLRSTGIKAEARITIRLFDELVIANGKYFQLGQGTAKSRLEFTCDQGAEATKVIQICDNRSYYALVQTQNEKRLEFVDLERVATANGTGNGIVGAPSNLMATGGIACLLQSLAAAFDFEEPVASQLGGIDMLTLRGKWKPEKLKMLLSDSSQTDPRTGVDWNQLPPQFPHAVSITLGNDDFFPLFPYRIEFYQNGGQTDPYGQSMLTLELYEVTKSAQLAPDLFRLDSDDAVLVDATEQYVVRVNQVQGKQAKSRQAASRNDSQNR